MTPEIRKQIEWTLLPLLTDVLPHVFANGAKFHGFRAECDACAASIELPEIHGDLVPVDGNRCVLNARAKCPSCEAFCEYHYLLNAEGEMSVLPLQGPSASLTQ
ncbi:hypothetical protein [Ferrimonas pelagia]|uniref:Uncharacterized protein n=1 Tax=Ferrimonas pelagia TaxID=1177826 RepID=A0ABP9F9C1_9GAMM